jgi:hypothetical protein
MLELPGRLPQHLTKPAPLLYTTMNNQQSIDHFRSVLVAARVKSLAPKKPEEGWPPLPRLPSPRQKESRKK